MQATKMYEVTVKLIFTDDEKEKVTKKNEKYLVTDAIGPNDAFDQAYKDLTKTGGTFEFEITGVKESNIVKIITE